MAKNLQFLPGCFQCFAARKVRSVVLRLIKTGKLCRILPIRRLDSRTHYQNVLRHSFSILDNTGKSGPVSSQSQCFISPEVTLAI